MIINGERYGITLTEQEESEDDGIILFEGGRKREDFRHATITISNNTSDRKFSVGDEVLVDANSLMTIKAKQDRYITVVREIDIILRFVK